MPLCPHGREVVARPLPIYQPNPTPNPTPNHPTAFRASFPALQVAGLKKRWDCGARKNCTSDCLAATRPPPACPAMGPGVCGKDGRLYPNECLAKASEPAFFRQHHGQLHRQLYCANLHCWVLPAVFCGSALVWPSWCCLARDACSRCRHACPCQLQAAKTTKRFDCGARFDCKGGPCYWATHALRFRTERNQSDGASRTALALLWGCLWHGCYVRGGPPCRLPPAPLLLPSPWRAANSHVLREH